MGTHVCRLFCGVAMLGVSALLCADWPQWRGPRRDGVSREKGLAERWPEGGPKKLWSVSGLGKGYATVSVVDGVIYTTGVFGDRGKLIAIKDGNVLGTVDFGRDVAKGRGYPGSRSTPTIQDGRIFVMSGFGVVTCFEQKSGKVLWQVDTFERFGGRQIAWNVSESLLVHKGNVICTPGGPEALVAALDVRSGRTAWRTTGLDSKSAYCSPIVVNHNGRDLLLTMVEYGAVGIDADNGTLLWKHAHKNKYAVHAATPIYHKGHVFITSGYGHGSECLQLSAGGDAVRRVYRTPGLDNHHGGVVRVGEYVYGTNNRAMVCVDITSGDVKWQDRAVGKGSLTVADGMIVAYGERGHVGLIHPDPDACRMVSRFSIEEGDGQHWAHPVVADGILFIRHGDVLMAFDVSKE